MIEQRRYGLDFLRALMMLLGVVLHAAASFVPGEPDATWPYRDPERSGLLGLLAVFIHMFRMPAFFVLAGFFLARSLERRRVGQVVADRTLRLLVPLVVGWFVLSPLVKSAFMFAIAQSSNAHALTTFNIPSGISPDTWTQPHPMHLWFLWYLWMFIIMLAGLRVASNRFLPERLCSWWDRRIDTVLLREGALIPGMLLTATTLFAVINMKMPSIDTPGSFVPNPTIFLCYLFFFWIGARLYALGGRLSELTAKSIRRLVRSGVFTLLFMIGCLVWFDALTKTGSGSRGAFLFAQLSFSLAIWPLILGSAGLAERFITREFPLVRYLSDSAYWVYVVHLPLCIAIAAALRHTPYSATTKCGITIGVTLAVCLATYEATKAILPRRGGTSGVTG